MLLLFTLLTTIFPPKSGYVNDFAGLLTYEQTETLEQKLEHLYSESSLEIVVVTIDSLNGETVRNTSTRIGNEWSVGYHEGRNGIVLLISKAEKEVFAAIDAEVTQLISSRETQNLVNKTAIPLLRKRKYFEAISELIDQIEIKWVYAVASRNIQIDRQNSVDDVVISESAVFFGVVLVALFLILIIYVAKRTESYRKQRGGIWGHDEWSSENNSSGFFGDGGGGNFGDGDSGDSGSD